MRILVIGGTRFIGATVVRQLLAQRHEVTVFHRGQTNRPEGCQHILGDRAQLADFRTDFMRFAPDVVLDMIPFIEQHASTTMSAFRGITPRIVAISSCDVYRAYGRLLGSEPGEPDPVPLTENSPLREKLYPYPYRGITPRASEDKQRWMDDYDKIPIERIYMSDPALPGTILRLPQVYGPGDNQHRLFEFLKRMDDKRPAILLDKNAAQWRWTRSYVENVAAAITLAITDDRAAGHIYNVGEAQTMTMNDWVTTIARVVGWQGKLMIVPTEHLPEQLRVSINATQDLLTDSSLIRRELGYREQLSLDEGLRRTIAWERANPPEEVDPGQFDYAPEDAIITNLKNTHDLT